MTGGKLRRPLAGFSQSRKPSRAISSGTPLAGGNPSGYIFEDTNSNAWYMWVDTSGCLRIQPAPNVEPNPQTNLPSVDFLTAANAFLATPFQKLITGMSDATATSLLTVTVPNVAVGATVMAFITASLGAGGAVGAFESNDSCLYCFTVTRTAGLAMTAGGITLGAGNHTSSQGVAGANTCTLSLGFSSVSGGNTATQTASLQATVTKGGGASSNHQCNIVAWLFNSTATGVSLS